MGCAHVVESTITFHDGTQRDVITLEQDPSILNSAVITSVEDPKTKVVQTEVQGGTSVGKAAIDIAQTAGMLGMGALIGSGSSSSTLNVNLKPVTP